MSTRRQPKPWPMKWIVVAILVFVAGYTAVNFYFRKPNRPYRPYQDAQDRATTARLLAAGWTKMPVETRRPVERPAFDELPATVARAAGGLGPDLEPKFAEKPALLASIDRVTAPSVVERGADYVLHFTASLSDLKGQVGDLSLYRNGQQFVLVPSIEKLPGQQLMSRWNDSSYSIQFSTAGLPAGRYQMRIVAKGPAAEWSFVVR